MRAARIVEVWLLVSMAAACAVRAPAPPPAAPPPPQLTLLEFTATAYSIEGKTASGARTRRGIVAADPAVLPMGTRIRIHDAGKYSGEYVVKDTGKKIDGYELDIYLTDDAEASRFGKRKVKVEILEESAPHAGGT